MHSTHRDSLLHVLLQHTSDEVLRREIDVAWHDIAPSPDLIEEDADVVVTAIGMRRRLERHVSWEIAVSWRLRLLPSYLRLRPLCELLL